MDVEVTKAGTDTTLGRVKEMILQAEGTRIPMMRMIDRYAGEFIYLQDGEVKWNGPDPSHIGSHRDFTGEKPGSALFLKKVDPDEREGERFDAYENCLRLMRA